MEYRLKYLVYQPDTHDQWQKTHGKWRIGCVGHTHPGHRLMGEVRKQEDRTVVKNPPTNTGDSSSTPGLGRSLGEGNGNPLQYSCLENSMDRGAWRTTVQGVPKSWTGLSDFHLHEDFRNLMPRQ